MKYFLLVALLLASVAHAGESKCERALSLTPTESFIAYVSELHEQGVVIDADLAALAQELINPIPVDRSATNTATSVARTALAELIAEQSLDARAVAAWARGKLSERGIIQQKREQEKQNTRDTSYKMEFVPVGAFEVMSTPVTQNMWFSLMHENPSHFSGPRQGDHPVEQVSWWSAIVYANELSKAHGLEPAYDLSGIKFVDRTRDNSLIIVVLFPHEIFSVAARGALSTLEEENTQYGTIKQVALNFNPSAEGYRLPTREEQNYLLQGAGTSTARFHFGNNEKELDDYAWYGENSEKQTHAVAGKKPFVIDGKPIFDLMGNVWEWSFSAQQRDSIDVLYRALRGGSWNEGTSYLGYTNNFCRHPGTSQNNIGFRLLRTLK